MDRDVPVPSKIVIMGTSKVTLHDRFSELPSPTPKVIVKKPQTTSVVRRASAPPPARFPPNPRMKQELVDYGDLEDDFDMEEVIEEEYEEEPVSIVSQQSAHWRPPRGRVSRVPRPQLSRPVYQQRERIQKRVVPVPIENRISFSKPRLVFVPVPTFSGGGQQRGFQRGGNRGGMMRGGGIQKNYRYHYNAHQNQNGSSSTRGGVFNNRRGASNSGSGSGGFRGSRGSGRGGRGGSGGHQNGTGQPKKSQEELDRELDLYMRKSKHPQISIDMEQ